MSALVSSKRVRPEVSYDETVRRSGSFVAGPGRGKRPSLRVVGLRRLTAQAAIVDESATADEIRGALRRGQFLSGRHFRFVSEWCKHDVTKETRLVWSHFEEMHGKDMSDWECGRQKWLLFCQEMRHTKEKPTWMRTSEEVA